MKRRYVEPGLIAVVAGLGGLACLGYARHFIWVIHPTNDTRVQITLDDAKFQVRYVWCEMTASYVAETPSNVYLSRV